MEHLKEIIRSYLEEDKIDSAIFINGAWGTGKTYFWINELEPFIRNTKNTLGSYFEPIYISLNGISSNIDIINQLSLNLFSQKYFSKLKNKIPQKIPAIALSILNTLSQLFLKKELKNINKIKFTDFIDFKDKVLCFDDLERKSEKITLEEIIGFINTNFLENHYIKVVVIGSENDIYGKDEKERFILKKEKIFYREIKFEIEFEKVFDPLCNQILKDEKLRKVVMENKVFLINLFLTYNIKNLRTVKSIFLTLNFLFKNFNSDFFYKHIISIFLFTVIITKEFKEGKLHYNLKDAYKNLNFQMDNRVKFAMIDQTKDSSYVNEDSFRFYNNYIRSNKNSYNFFRSIYNYIIFGYSEKELFNLDENELKENRKEILLESLQWFQNLSSQDELRQICDELLSYLQKGDILFYNYPFIFSKYEEIVKNKIYDKSLEHLFTVFKTGLDISYSNYDQILLEQNKSTVIESDSKYVKELKEKVNHYHEEIREKKEKALLEKIFIEFDLRGGEFEKYLGVFRKKELFKYFQSSYILNRILNAKPPTISAFTSFLYQKYNNDSYSTFKNVEELEKLNEMLKKEVENIQDNLKKYVISGLIEQIDLILPELIRKRGKLNIE